MKLTVGVTLVLPQKSFYMIFDKKLTFARKRVSRNMIQENRSLAFLDLRIWEK